MVKTFLEMLAPTVQRLKSTFYGLHHRCKGQKVVFAICTTGATAQKQFFLFAPAVQAFPKALWPLQCALWKTFSKDKGPSFLELTSQIIVPINC